ncbi:hypothetical protein HYV82_01830 [Candidatus Woesearchaeota archaeon]|nr:hypothetical protein [Candidatus Woesearchaeota archaeon]
MAEQSLILIPALFMGGVLGLIELFFVHADERGMGWLGHGLHALPATMIFTFVSMNVGYALTFVGQAVSVTPLVELGVRAFIAIVAMLKISAAAAIVGRVGEKFPHTLAMGALVFAVPYIWQFTGPSLVKLMPFLG